MEVTEFGEGIDWLVRHSPTGNNQSSTSVSLDSYPANRCFSMERRYGKQI